MADWVDALAADGGLAEEVWRGLDDGGDADDGLVEAVWRGLDDDGDADADLAEAVWRGLAVDGADADLVEEVRRGLADDDGECDQGRGKGGGAPPLQHPLVGTKQGGVGTKQGAAYHHPASPSRSLDGEEDVYMGQTGGGAWRCQRPWCRAVSAKKANDCKPCSNRERGPGAVGLLQMSADKKEESRGYSRSPVFALCHEGKRFSFDATNKTITIHDYYPGGETYELYHHPKEFFELFPTDVSGVVTDIRHDNVEASVSDQKPVGPSNTVTVTTDAGVVHARVPAPRSS